MGRRATTIRHTDFPHVVARVSACGIRLIRLSAGGFRKTGCWCCLAWLLNTSSKKPGGDKTTSGWAKSIRTIQTRMTHRDNAYPADRPDLVSCDFADRPPVAITSDLGIPNGPFDNGN